jgi:hypothetical protein
MIKKDHTLNKNTDAYQTLRHRCKSISLRCNIFFRDSSADIVMGYELDDPGSIPGMAGIFSTTSRPALGPTQIPTKLIPRAISPGVKYLGREADHSPPPSGEVKKCGAIPPLPHVFMTSCLIN